MKFQNILCGVVGVLASMVPLAAEEPAVEKPDVRFTDTGFAVAGGKAAWGDFDNDGFVDLFAGGVVWRNEGGKAFTKLAELGGEGIAGDYDNDGYLDVFLYSRWAIMRNEGGKSFKEMEAMVPELPMSVTRGAVWGDFNGDGYLDLYIGGYETPDYQPDAILTNAGGEKFTKTWQQSDDIDPSRGITAADFDEDGDLDIYVSNYRVEQNQLWRNDGKGNFTNAGQTHGVAGTDDGWTYSYGHTIGSAWGDMDSDGHLDLFVGNFSHPPAWQDRPRFYRNLGKEADFKFEDKTEQAGLGWQESFASPALGDVNNDGLLDLYFTTVYGGDHNVLYMNEGDFHFTDVTATAGIAEEQIYQAAFADFDNDGDLDLATNGRIYRNESVTGNWLKVRLHGDGVKINRSAIGAQVRVGLDARTITRQVEAGTGEGNQNALTLHFGVGEATGKLRLDILWPDGTLQQAEAQVNHTVEFTYGR